MRYAAIDAGTNSCRLLIADIDGDCLNIRHRDLETTRLGEGLQAGGFIKDEARDRTIACLQRFENSIDKYKTDKYRIIATSAVREARNRGEFLETAGFKLKKAVEVISGEEEACLSYLGVKKGLGLQKAPLVVDLGGGSTEFIFDDGTPFLLSLPLGAVRATEGNISREATISILRDIIRNRERFAGHPLVFVGGTATTLVAIQQGIKNYRRELIHGQSLTYRGVKKTWQMLSSLSLEDRKGLPGLQPERADIIVKGVLILLTIMECLERTVILVSESDLLEGVIWRLSG